MRYSVFAFPYNDKGISRRYFEEILKSGGIDILFGTRGMIKDNYSCSLQRFWMEAYVLPAEKIVAMQYAKQLVRTAIGRG